TEKWGTASGHHSTNPRESTARPAPVPIVHKTTNEKPLQPIRTERAFRSGPKGLFASGRQDEDTKAIGKRPLWNVREVADIDLHDWIHSTYTQRLWWNEC